MRDQRLVAWAMGAPALIGLAVFVVLPLVLGAYWSLTDKRLISPLPTTFVGLRNYSDLLGLDVIRLDPLPEPGAADPQADPTVERTYPRLRPILQADPRYAGFAEWFHFEVGDDRIVVLAKDPTFMRSLVNTVAFVLVIVPGQGGLALILALLVQQRIRGVKVYRSIYFSPVVTSMAVMAIVWSFLYNPEEGLINRFLNTVTLGASGSIPWLQDTDTALLAIIVVSVWQAVGFQMVIFLAGLQGIAEELYEAAKVDGANAWARFRYITFPQLRNTTIFVIISTTILAFRLFTQVDVMTKGGPQDATSTIVFYAVTTGFRQQKIGYASAITIVFFLIVVTIALTQRALLRTERAVPDG